LGSLPLLVVALALAAGVVLAAAGLVPAALAVLVVLASTLVGSVGRPGALVAGGIAAIRGILGTGRLGGWRLAARRGGGQHRRTFTPRRGNRPTGLGVLDDQG
jgi:hypothetical protein